MIVFLRPVYPKGTQAAREFESAPGLPVPDLRTADGHVSASTMPRLFATKGKKFIN